MEETPRALDLKRCVLALETPASDAVMGGYLSQSVKQCIKLRLEGVTAEQANGHEAWKALIDVVHNVSEIMLQTLPNFWKVGKGYMDGKYQSRSSTDKAHPSKAKNRDGRRSTTQVKVMTNEMINMYISLLGEFFNLSSSTTLLTPQPNADGGADLAEPDLPSFAPGNCNALATGWWLLKVLGELNDCTNDIGGLANLGSEAMNGFKEFMSSVRWRFTEAICAIWVKGVWADMQADHPNFILLTTL